MKKYEAVIILNERKFDDEGKAYIDKIAETLKGFEAQDISLNNLGRKQFARPIKKKNSGLYWNLIFSLDPSKVKEFQETYKLEEVILRFVVFNYEVPDNPKLLSFEKH